VLEGKRFSSAREVTAKSTKVLTEVSENGFQECFQNLYERCKIVIAQGNYAEVNVM
jgi:hypothetical protein